MLLWKYRVVQLYGQRVVGCINVNLQDGCKTTKTQNHWQDLLVCRTITHLCCSVGPMTVFAERSAGAGLMLMTLVAYSLKDGADRGKLGATTFRWLNLGLAGSLLSMVW